MLGTTASSKNLEDRRRRKVEDSSESREWNENHQACLRQVSGLGLRPFTAGYLIQPFLWNTFGTWREFCNDTEKFNGRPNRRKLLGEVKSKLHVGSLAGDLVEAGATMPLTIVHHP